MRRRQIPKELADLEDFGYADRRPDPDALRVRAIHLTPSGRDALRVRAIHLTPSGRDALRHARRTAGEFERGFFSALGPQEQRTLHDLLPKLSWRSRTSPAADQR